MHVNLIVGQAMSAFTRELMAKPCSVPSDIFSSVQESIKGVKANRYSILFFLFAISSLVNALTLNFSSTPHYHTIAEQADLSCTQTHIKSFAIPLYWHQHLTFCLLGNFAVFFLSSADFFQN